MIKYCKKHGETNFFKRKPSGFRCNKCAAESVVDMRRRNKVKLVEMFGGCCVDCGYNKDYKALQFHHKEPSTKEFGIGSSLGASYSLKRQIKEAEKCILLCANCHIEKHSLLV
jgi:Zn ribbon nucleic-acid-binding protein